MTTHDEDAVSRALAALEHELAGVATVEHAVHEAGAVRVVTATPARPGARAVTWACLDDDQIVLSVGSRGGRWELDRSVPDVAFLLDVVRSVVAGRVRETFAPGRSHVEVQLGDGSLVSETGYTSWFPLPGWRRWGRTVRYTAYAP